uniref:Uncharacterized protein n=1 Tax=Magallana gigas TaxID=29159 RepID=A0A8W8JCL5_MAGGI
MPPKSTRKATKTCGGTRRNELERRAGELSRLHRLRARPVMNHSLLHQTAEGRRSAVGSVVENQCIWGLITGEQIQVSLPAAEMSIGNPKGSHVPVAIREKIWAGAYIDLPLLLKQGRDLRTDPHITGKLVINRHRLIRRQLQGRRAA